jgi:hypothetical protein
MKQPSPLSRRILKLLPVVPIFIIGFYAIRVFAMERITTIPTSFRIELILPGGYRFNSRAPSSLTVGSPEATTEQIEVKNTTFDITISIPSKPQFTLAGEARVFFCEDLAEPQCFMKQFSFNKEFNADTPRLLEIEIPNPKTTSSSSS